MAERVFTIVERAPDWRLEVWTKERARGRLLYQGNLDQMMGKASACATLTTDAVHILPRTAADWYSSIATYNGRPT